MEKNFFGTDGIRGRFNQFPITSDFFFKLAQLLSIKLGDKKKNNKIIIGKDTRKSGSTIESALVSGFISMGNDCTLLGVVPTPLLSFMTKHLSAEIGIMISASHNPFYDNGIKLFDRNGEKFTDREELKIEKLINKNLELEISTRFRKGNVKNFESNFSEYKKIINKFIPKNISFENLKVVIDYANGSAFSIASNIFQDYSISPVEFANEPNGKNINSKCGALHPNKISDIVKKNKADIGIAFDGDADRLIICDEKGNIINGDKILAIVSSSMQKQGKLKGDGIVVTKMSNLGLHSYLKKKKIKVFRCNVGDRYVVEKMKKTGCNLGGEQSGHLIFSDYCLTGDAIMSALQVLTILKLENKKLSQLLKSYVEVPQKLINLKLNTDIKKILKNQILFNLIDDCKKLLSLKGNLLIRKSGTENLLRIMVQCNNKKLKEDIINKLSECIKKIDKEFKN